MKTASILGGGGVEKSCDLHTYILKHTKGNIVVTW